MKFCRIILFSLFVVASGAAAADYEVTYTFVNGAKRTADNLVVQGGKVILAKDNLQVPFEQIAMADFTFEEPLPVEQCEILLKQASYNELAEQLEAFLSPVKQALNLPGNLDVYIQYNMRACFWTEQYEEALGLARILQAKGSRYAPLASLYELMIMLEEQQPVEDIRTALGKIENPEEISGAMVEYIRGRLALEDTKYDQALQHFARVLVYYRRDPEWVPAATFQEGTIYRSGGEYDKMSAVRKELKLAYPDRYWGERATELN